MNAIKFLVAVTMVLVSATVNAQGGIIYQNVGPHHRTTIILPLDTSPRGVGITQQAYPVGTRLHVLCEAPGWPIDYRGQPACRLPDGRLMRPLRVEVEMMGNAYPGYGGMAVQGYAGTVPADRYGRCPPGMGPAPRTPQELPGCW